MVLKKLTISNFKGIAERSINFSARTVISGENGSGKTTIMDAYFWLMSGKDSTLVDNPNVIPIGATECMPTVEAEFDIEGKIVTVRKVQKYKIKDGKESTSNQYIVNEVPMTERDFKAKLEEYGIDDRFLVFSHPDFLLNDTSKKGREYVRNKILFPMAQELSDKEVAEKAELPELSKLLDDYTVAEIEAKNKATLKRINDEIGKDNVIANARIDELSKSKSGVSGKNIEQQIVDVKEKIANNQNNQNTVQKKLQELELEIMHLQFDANAFVSAQNDEISRKKLEMDKSIADLSKLQGQANNEVKRLETLIEVKQETVDNNESRIKYLFEKLETTKAEQFDEKKTVCPTCGQIYPVDMAEQIKSNFELEKAAKIDSAKAEIEELKVISETRKAEIAEYYSERDTHIAKAKEHGAKITELQKEIEAVEKNKPDFQKSDGYIAFMKQIDDRQTEIVALKANKYAEIAEELNNQLAELSQAKMRADEKADIDRRINEIREDIKQAEINRANAEKVLYQIEQLNKAKNEMLEESVNKHFKIVRWKLFKTLKNGNTEDACIPIIDGFNIGTANHGREVLAKIDIINGLSAFYGKNYPVFIDNAEGISDVTRERYDFDGQLIELIVTNDKELKIE